MISQTLAKYIPNNGIILILGHRGSGKSVLAYSILEYLYLNIPNKTLLVYNPPKPDIFPKFIKPIYSMDFPKNSAILIDEAYIEFSSRSSMNKKNKTIDMLNGLARQKDLLIIYITQDSTRVDINIIRSADILMVKRLSKRQIDFERKEIKKWLSNIKLALDAVDDCKKAVYIDCDTEHYQYSGVITNCITLPSFWSEELSRAWENVFMHTKNDYKPYMLSDNEINRILRNKKFKMIFDKIELEIPKDRFNSFKEWFDYCIELSLKRFFAENRTGAFL